jgi:prefoldin beta subunit
MNRTDPEMEKMLVEYQNAERQLQSIVMQKYQLQTQVNEITLAQDELKKASGDVYKSVGSVMVKTTKGDAENDLKEKKDLANIRVNTLAKQEEKLRAHMQTIQTKLEAKMKGAGSG